MVGSSGSLAAALLTALTIAAAPAARAADAYPSRPITMIVPFGAGGGTDVIARAVSDELSRAAQPVHRRGCAARSERRHRFRRRRARSTGRLHPALHGAIDLFAQSQPHEGTALRPVEGPGARRHDRPKPLAHRRADRQSVQVHRRRRGLRQGQSRKARLPVLAEQRARDGGDVRRGVRHPDPQGALQGPGRGDDRLSGRAPSHHGHGRRGRSRPRSKPARCGFSPPRPRSDRRRFRMCRRCASRASTS